MVASVVLAFLLIPLLVVLLVVLVEERSFCWGLVITSPNSDGAFKGNPVGPASDTPVLGDKGQLCDFDGPVRIPERNVLNVTLEHQLFKTDSIVAGIVYQMVLRKIHPGAVDIDFTLTTLVKGISRGNFINNANQINQCGTNVFKSMILTHQESITVNWTIDKYNQGSNLTLRVDYQLPDDPSLYRIIHTIPISQDCQLQLKPEEATVTSDLLPPHISACQVWFPSYDGGHGVVIEIIRLNVPCPRGYIHVYVYGSNTTSHQLQHPRSHPRLCGKLEELSEVDRHIYIPSSGGPPLIKVAGNPVFALTYRLVDYCYNVTFKTRNGSVELKPTRELECTFKIYLPYGNRIVLSLEIGDNTSRGIPPTKHMFELEEPNGEDCDGLLVHVLERDNDWSHCSKPSDPEHRTEVISRENKITLRVQVRSSRPGGLGLRITYRAIPVEEIVGMCGFGWVALKQFCISVVDESKLSWAQAEMECNQRGGHLASVRSEHAQNVINNVLLNSPEYRNNNAYWIGASDTLHEGNFRWSDGLPFFYTNWFPGWSQHGQYNRQPNDDGLSEQDCVEIRRNYLLPTSSVGLVSSFMWNDRDCSTLNYFICERLLSDEPSEDHWFPDCNRSVKLSKQQFKTTVSSPGFPRHYPNNADCNTDITAPSGYRVVLDFEELILENESSCAYDYLEITEDSVNGSTSSNSSNVKRLCGDWSNKLKLLRYVSKGPKLNLRFSSDYSHHFGGYRAVVSIENAMQCLEDHLLMFNDSCYLVVSHPKVTWAAAQQICRGRKGQLASVLNAVEERFIKTNIRKSPEYQTSALYWLGAKSDPNSDGFAWVDGNPMDYSGWPPTNNDTNRIKETRCLGIQWTPSSAPTYVGGLYWKSRRCTSMGGYICKRPSQILRNSIDFSKTISGSEGSLTTPYYPDNYYNDLDFSVRIIGPDRTRLVIKFDKIDIETQLECLYDYVELKSNKQSTDVVRYCSTYDTEMHRFNFVSESNEVEVIFHSDYSISGEGFSLTWKTVDVSACPIQTLTAKEGIITSPNYLDFLLAHLNCSYTIVAPIGKRIWLEFQVYDVRKILTVNDFINKQHNKTVLELSFGQDSIPFKPFEVMHLLTDGSFLSQREILTVRLHTGDNPVGMGFKALYKVVSLVDEEKTIILKTNSTGLLLHLNYPGDPPLNMTFAQHFIAPLGCVVTMEFFHLKHSSSDCLNNSGIIAVQDNYYNTNGTSWKLCYDADIGDAVIPVRPITITSFFNTIHLIQESRAVGISLNATLRVEQDPDFKAKLLKYKEGNVETCTPSPCQNGGKCITKGVHRFCRCPGHFTGIFCTLTICELQPCVFGRCELTNTSYKCHCKKGYVGSTCEQKRRPCEGNPCESRGTCIEKGDDFQCQCHAWWEGARCEKRMLHIPYKPLSERMFHEPFWLGLMTVFIVMTVIGLVWCAKRHFPEKIEKLLAEEQDRNRSTMSSLRSSSVREQLAMASGSGGSVPVVPSPGPATSRSFFGRLGIRKPSILSLTSPHASGHVSTTARTFSLDDLLKPPPRRTPSPKKKRNNSTPTRKNVAEKKQILQQLISPGNKQMSRKVSLCELMQMSERNLKEGAKQKHDDPSTDMRETAFYDNECAKSVLNDPKLEKKVTFARLLNKVSAEMSSSSDVELGIMQSGRLGCMVARASSTPPSPNVDTRTPNSMSSNQGSNSFTSSDLAIPSALSSSISDFLTSRKSGIGKSPGGRSKPTSADSILAMFHNFSSSNSGGLSLPSPLRMSPSTSPTGSSPHDDINGDDESSTSSVYTPVSFSSGPPESPIMHRQSTIEVPVLDPLNAHKSQTSGSNFLHPPTIMLELPSTINKCLSPIKEMPTPLPSPALTPMMRRSTACSSGNDGSKTDNTSLDLPNLSISDDDNDDIFCTTDIIIDPQAEDGLILEEAAFLQKSTRAKTRPPLLGQLMEPTASSSQPLIIPTLTIQTPSPVHTKSPTLLLPGSPPPYRSRLTQETSCFQFPSPKSTRKLYKDLDKPTSLDLPCVPPMITITCNMSEVESDVDSISPAVKSVGHLGVAAGCMTHLSPFYMGARGDHMASESNLSSSGYSSMTSPGPSRCGSSNPLCPSEAEDQGSSGGGGAYHRRSPIPKTTPNPSDTTSKEQRRGRSDSETLSDDPQHESNDEGIGTDHIDEKIEDLKLFVVGESDCKTMDLAPVVPRVSVILEDDKSTTKTSLQLPSIVVHYDSASGERHLSPMSSRSESPLSDRTTELGRFSSKFYGQNKDLLPFTDSDGLYDFPSSDKVNVMEKTQHKKTNRKRDKKTLRNCKTPSPTKLFTPPSVHSHLDIPTKDNLYKMPPPRKLSPKRKITRSKVVSSSSSSDSITSQDVRLTLSSPGSDTVRCSSPIVSWLNEKSKSHEGSGEEYCDDANSAMLPKSKVVLKNQKISRLRAISHQIRFLRRLELSLKKRERTVSPSDSLDSEDGESPRATSPLLQRPKSENRLSSDVQANHSTKTKKGRHKSGEFFVPPVVEKSWRKIVTTENDHSD